MKAYARYLRVIAVVFGVIMLSAFSGWARADPPSRVARLGYLSGAVSFSPAGESDWVEARINRPLTTGDRLWTDAGGRAEIQIGGAVVRMNAGTAVSLLNLDDQITQLQLSEGTLNVRVRRLERGQVFEVNTPNLAFSLRQPGAYRIEVDPDDAATSIILRKGEGEVYGEGAAYVIDARRPYRFTGTDLREYQYGQAPRLDDFDRWSSDRDRRYDSSVSARYVSQDVVGYQDLDANGTWRVDATYGNVWTPNRVAAGWAPYRDGHWAWIDPWGWTWVDDAPWGFAVSHYGRWANLGGTWGWIPGPVRSRAYYAPALVVFVGGDNFQLTLSSGNVGGVAWFPLGPREVYRPSYPVSRGYFENVNVSNTVITNTVINNYYDNSKVTNVVYANREVPGAIVAVPVTAFVQSQPVSRAAVRVSREMIVSAPVASVPAVAPTERSVHGAAAQADKKPNSRVFERPVVARTAPPAAHVGFAAQQQQLKAKSGRPLDEAERKELKPAAAAPAPVVKVVAPTQEAPPTQRPPPVTTGTSPGNARGKSDQGKNRAAPEPQAQPVEPRGPAAAPAPATAPQVVSPAPAAQPPEQKPGRSEQRGKPEPREQRGKPEPREQRVAPPASQRTAEPQIAPPAQATPPEQAEPAAQKPKQQGKPESAPAAAEQAAPAAQKPKQQGKPESAPAAGEQAAPAAQKPKQQGKPESAPAAAKQAEPGPPAVDAPKQPPPQSQPAPAAKPDGQEPKSAADRAKDKKKDREEQKREEEERKKNR